MTMAGTGDPPVKPAKATTTRAALSRLRFYDGAHDWLESASQRAFYRVGYWIATHRAATLLAGLAACLLCMIGFLNITMETDGIDLWVPANSQSMQDMDTLEDAFGKPDEEAALLFVASDRDASASASGATEGPSILTRAHMEQIWKIYDDVLAVTAGPGQTYRDVCARNPRGACEVYGILEFWGADRAAYDAADATEADLLSAVSATAFPDGSPVSRELEFGGLVTAGASGAAVVAARAVRLAFPLRADDSDGWQANFVDTMGVVMPQLRGVDGYYFAERSVDDELARSISGEIYLFAVTYVLMVLFAMLTLGNIDRVRGRGAVGIMCVTSILISAGGAYGLCAGMGVPFTSLQQVLPFLLVGIGLDDAFVIAGAVDNINKDLPTAERIALALSRCGLSVTYTSVINFAVFMLGANSTLPAISYFCIYAGVAVAFDFCFQASAFVALMAWDTDRQRARRYDLLCCKNDKRAAAAVPPPAEAAAAAAGAAAAAPAGAAAATGASAAASSAAQVPAGSASAVGRALRARFLPALLSPAGAAAAAAALLALAGACAWGVTRVQLGLELLTLLPDDSYAREYVVAARDYGMYQYDDANPIQLAFEGVDAAAPGAQADMLDLQSAVMQSAYVQGPLSSWLSDFLAWAADSPAYASAIDADGYFADADAFAPALATFLALPDYARYHDDVELDAAAPGGVATSRVWVYSRGVDDVASQEDSMRELRGVVSASALGDDRAFTFSSYYVNVETDIVLVQQVLLDFAYGLIVVFLCSLLILGRLRYTLMLTGLVALLDMEIVGCMYFWGLHLNTVTAVQLVMAAGLLTDLCVHIIHYFIAHGNDATLTRRTRILDAAAEIGPSVLFAGLTLFLGTLPMAFATNDIFRTFFRMTFSIIGLGLLGGLITVPLLLWAMPERRRPPAVAAAAAAASDAAAGGVQKGGAAGVPAAASTARTVRGAMSSGSDASSSSSSNSLSEAEVVAAAAQRGGIDV